MHPKIYLIYILPAGMISGVEERRFSQNWACVEKRALKKNNYAKELVNPKELQLGLPKNYNICQAY